MTVLETERLIPRPLTGDDFDDYAAMLADPDVASGLAEHVGSGAGASAADAWRNLATFIGHREIRGYSHWALVEKGPRGPRLLLHRTGRGRGLPPKSGDTLRGVGLVCDAHGHARIPAQRRGAP